MTEPGLARRPGKGRLALAVGLVGIAVAFVTALGTSRRAVHRVTLTAGPFDTTRNQLARMLADSAAATGVRARLVETTGTEDALERVNAGAVDFALVSSAYRIKPYEHVQEATPLNEEALHLLVKEELAGDVGRSLAGLRGRTVDLGPPGSATAGIATAVMDFAGLASGNAASGGVFAARSLGDRELESLIGQGDRAVLPDAVFHLDTLPSKIAVRLVRTMRYRLVPLPFADAFRLNALIEKDTARGPGSSIVRRDVGDTVIPAYTYRMAPPVPPGPTHTLGTRLLLVVNDRVPPEVVERMLDGVFGSHFSRITQPALDRSVLGRSPRLTPHPGRVRYAARELPILTNANVDKINNTLGILGALGGGGFFLWQWWRQRRQARRDEVFGSYMRQVAGIERRTVELELSATLRLEPLVDLQRGLLRLKSEALDRFASGELGGASALSDLLGPINSARDQIGDLILHFREDIEEEAKAEGKTAQALWAEAIEKSEKPGDSS